MKHFLKNNKKVLIIAITIIALSVIRFILVYGYPIHPLTGAGEDDALMVKLAYSKADGRWLGEYRYNTLMKRPFFPILLSFLYLYKIRYLSFVTLFYIASCILFVLSIRKSFENKYLIILAFFVLLFNPIMYSTEVFLRVYRNSLIPAYALLIPACYFGLYKNRHEKIYKFILWSIIGSGALSTFYYTREDSMWIVPFVIFITCIILVTLVVKAFQDKKVKNFIILIVKMFFLALPIIATFAFGEKIARKNEIEYGVKTKNVLSDSYFTDALDAIYAVKPNEEIDCVTLTQEKAKRMADVSPTFRMIYPYLVETIGGYGSLDRSPGDAQCEDGWILWAIRTAAPKAGFNNLLEEQMLYKAIAEELNKAMDEGYLERQKTMPSPLLSPYRKGYGIKAIKAFVKGIWYMTTFKDVAITSSEVVEKVPDKYREVHSFEKITNERALYFKGTTVNGKEIEQLKDQDEYIESLQVKQNILTVLTKIYSVIGVVILAFGGISYIILTVKTITRTIKKDYAYVEKWIICSGVLGALFTLLAGISYNDAATASSIKVLYLCGTYPLFLAFGIITIIFCFEKEKKLLDDKTENQNQDSNIIEEKIKEE